MCSFTKISCVRLKIELFVNYTGVTLSLMKSDYHLGFIPKNKSPTKLRWDILENIQMKDECNLTVKCGMP